MIVDKVSVCISTIRPTITTLYSLPNQHFNELIILDNSINHEATNNDDARQIISFLKLKNIETKIFYKKKTRIGSWSALVDKASNEYIMALDDDVVLSPNTIDILMTEFDHNINFVSPRIITPLNLGLFDVKDFIKPTVKVKNKSRNKQFSLRTKPQLIETASGACLLFRKSDYIKKVRPLLKPIEHQSKGGEDLFITKQLGKGKLISHDILHLMSKINRDRVAWKIGTKERDKDEKEFLGESNAKN